MLEVDTKIMSYLFANVELIRYYLKLSSKRQKRFFLKARIHEYANQVNIKDQVDVEFYMKLFDKFLTNYLCKTAKFYRQLLDFANCPVKMGKLSKYALRMLRINLKLSKPVMQQVLVLNRPIISSFAANLELLSDTVALEAWTGGRRSANVKSKDKGKLTGIDGGSNLARRSGFRFGNSRMSGRGLGIDRVDANETIEEQDEGDGSDEEGDDGIVYKTFKRSSAPKLNRASLKNHESQLGNNQSAKKDSIFATIAPNAGPRESDFSLGRSLYQSNNPMHLTQQKNQKRRKHRQKGKFSVKLENKIVNRLLDKIGHSNQRRFKSIDCGRALKKRSMMRKSVLFLNPNIAQRNSKILQCKSGKRLSNLKSFIKSNEGKRSLFSSESGGDANFPKCFLKDNPRPGISTRNSSSSQVSGKRKSGFNKPIRASKTNLENRLGSRSSKQNLFKSQVQNILDRNQIAREGFNLKDLENITEQSEISNQENAIRERCLDKGSKVKREKEKKRSESRSKCSIPRFIDWGYELRKGLKMKKNFQRMARRASRPRVKKELMNKKMKNKIHFYMLKKNNLMEDNFVISAKEENFLLKHIVLFSIVKYNLFQRLQKISFKYTKKDVNMKDSNGNTPLYYSCQSGNLKITQFLIDRGAELNIKCQNGDTPVHMAFKSGSPQLIYKLFNHGADMNAVNNDNMTPLGYGTFGLLKELNLLDGFATFNEKRARNEIGKEHVKLQSIAKLQKSSTVLDMKVKKFLDSQFGSSRDQLSGGIRKSRSPKHSSLARRGSRQLKIKGNEMTPKSPSKVHLSLISPKLGRKKVDINTRNFPSSSFKRSQDSTTRRNRDKRKTMMIRPMNKEFLSNNLNYRIKRGKTLDLTKKSRKFAKKNTLDGTRRKKRSQKSLRQFKMSMEEFRLAQALKKKKENSKENNPFEFENDFREDTCGCDVFLLKKLPQMYDPKLPNEILFKVSKIREVNEHRGKFFKQRKMTTKTKENQELVNTALKCSKLTDNNKLAFNKSFEHRPSEMISSEIPTSDFIDI